MDIKNFELGKKENVFATLTIFLSLLSVFILVGIFGLFNFNKIVSNDLAKTMTFSGKGEVFSVADTVRFSFSVIEEGKNQVETQNLSAKKINAIIKYLKDSGIAEKDIKTENYNVYPRYEWQDNGIRCIKAPCPSTEKILVGYEINQSVSVKVREMEKAGEILANIGNLGASNLSGLDFIVDDEGGLKNEARRLAIEDAKKQAEELAKDLGVKLVRIVNFSESGYPMMYRDGMETMSAMGTAKLETPEIPAGENKITSNVSITYEIR